MKLKIIQNLHSVHLILSTTVNVIFTVSMLVPATGKIITFLQENIDEQRYNFEAFLFKKCVMKFTKITAKIEQRMAE